MTQQTIAATTHTDRPSTFGKSWWPCLSGLALAIAASGAHAQSVWTYEVIGSDNKSTVTYKPAQDISYPPAGQPVPIYDPNKRQGIPLTPQEAAARRNAPQLIIVLGPAY